jgi:hypothetical protein
VQSTAARLSQYIYIYFMLRGDKSRSTLEMTALLFDSNPAGLIN